MPTTDRNANVPGSMRLMPKAPLAPRSSSATCIGLLDKFAIDHVQPCLATNRWISAMIRLFRPQIEALLLQRDRSLANWQRGHPDRIVLDDEELEVTSSTPIDVDRQIAHVARAQKRRLAMRSRGDRKAHPGLR